MGKLPKLTPRQAEAAVARCGESLALTSGAGCGKTLVLARRFTTLLMAAELAGESPFDRFVALTFTDKAALEMTARVRAVLAEALAGSVDEADRRRIAGWITELPAAHISTIHSFCAGLLRRHAIAAGVDPAFTVLADQLVTTHMQAQAAEQAVAQAVEAGGADVLDLIAAADVGRVVDDVCELLAKRIAWRAADYADPKRTLDRWRKQQLKLRAEAMRRLGAHKDLRRELTYLSDYPCDDPDDKLAVYRDEKLSIIREIIRPPAKAYADDFEALGESPGTKGSRKAWGGQVKQFRRQLAKFVAGVAENGCWFEPLGEADERAAGCLAALTHLADRAGGIYAAAKRAAGVLDFVDLIDLTARLLHDNAAVRAKLRENLSQLLIDECQDTDVQQLRMLWELVAVGADGPPPREGLFIVGDVKQSIYRFRGARAEVFARLCERFGADARLALTESFRSHAAGVAFVNHVFGPLIPEYEPIRSKRKQLPGAPSVEILLAQPAQPTSADATAAQAQLVAERISQMIGREELVWDDAAGRWRAVRPGDVAILFARMTNSLSYEQALRQREIPYYVVAGGGFFQQQEIYDCLNALRVIDNPFDDVALMGLLRSGVFGLDDNALLHVARSAEPPYFDRLTDPAVLKALPDAVAEQLAFARELLGRVHRDKDALGPAGVIEALLDASGYCAVLLSEFGGNRKLGNVLRLVAAARSAEAAGGLSLADFVRRFGDLAVSQMRYEQAPVVGEAEDVVRIMTIHKAKGLEFPVVIIPDLNAGFRGPRGRLLLGDQWRLTYDPPSEADIDGDDEESSARNGSPVSFRLAKMAEETQLREENVRKLYVATTRHRDHLILVGADLRGKEGRLGSPGSYLHMLDEMFGMAEAVDTGASEIRYGDGFSAKLAKLSPASSGRRAKATLGQRAVAEADRPEQLAAALTAASSPAAPQLLTERPPVAAAGRIAPTALADFEHCPMLYRWRHELRTPEPTPRPQPRLGLDALAAGTLFHRCMQWLDLGAGDLAAQAGPLVGRVVGEMELQIAPAGVAEELAAMLKKFERSGLAKAARDAKWRLAELAFLYRSGGLELSGQIDLLYQDAQGAWHVVDYKSDRVEPDDVAGHAQRYELQMMIYLAAARRRFGQAADATLYFLRPGREHRFGVDEQAVAAFEEHLSALAEDLASCRLTGSYPRRGAGEAGLCPRCPYAPLCGRAIGFGLPLTGRK